VAARRPMIARSLAADAKGRPLRLILTRGQVHDATQASALVEGLHPSHVIADMGYDSQDFVEGVEQAGARAVIPPRASRKRPRACDADLYRVRWQVDVCRTQPVNLTRCPLRRAPWPISDLRGFVNREHVGEIDVRTRHHDCAHQAVSHRSALFTRGPVPMVTPQVPQGCGLRHDLVPRPRLVLDAGSWLALLRALWHLRGEGQPPGVSCAQTDPRGLIRVQSALALPLQPPPPLQELGWLRGEGCVVLVLGLCSDASEASASASVITA
jgi:transposase